VANERHHRRSANAEQGRPNRRRPARSIDSRYAHKPAVIGKDGVVYHFYCAVAPAADPKQGEIEYGEVRGISVAHS